MYCTRGVTELSKSTNLGQPINFSRQLYMKYTKNTDNNKQQQQIATATNKQETADSDSEPTTVPKKINNNLTKIQQQTTATNKTKSHQELATLKDNGNQMDQLTET